MLQREENVQLALRHHVSYGFFFQAEGREDGEDRSVRRRGAASPGFLLSARQLLLSFPLSGRQQVTNLSGWKFVTLVNIWKMGGLILKLCHLDATLPFAGRRLVKTLKALVLVKVLRVCRHRLWL